MENRDEILEKVKKLVLTYKQGILGGEKMPEDENPHLEKSSMQNYMYFTLPMALNYQRNSYCKCQYKNVGLLQNKNVIKPTFLFCILALF